MKCQKCGQENNTGSQFCGNCGASLANEQAQPKKRGGGLKIGIIAAIAVVVLGGGIFAATQLFDFEFSFGKKEEPAISLEKGGSQAAKKTPPKSDAPAEIVKYNVSGSADTLLSALSGYGNIFSADGLLSGKLSSSVKLSVSDKTVYELADIFEIDDEYLDLLRLIANSGLDFELAFDMGENDMFVNLNLALSLLGDKLLSADTLITEDTVFLSIPELLASSVAVPMEDSGYSLSELAAQINEAYAAAPQMTEYVNLLIENEALLKKAVDEIVAACADSFSDLEYDKNASVSISGKNVKLGAISGTFDEKPLIAAFKVLAGNSKYIDLIAEIANLSPYSYYTVTGEEIADELNYAIGELEEYGLGIDPVPFTLYTDKDKNFAGLALTIDEGYQTIEFALLFSDGDGYECRLETYDPDYPKDKEGFRVYGDLKSKSSSYSGTMVMDFYIEDYDLRGLKIMDFSMDGIGKSARSSECTVYFGKILTALLEDNLYYYGTDLTDYVDGFVLKVSASSKSSTDSSMNMTIENSKKGMSASIDLSYSLGDKVSYKLPKDVIRVEDEYDLMYELDIEEIFNNLIKVVDKAEKKGFDLYWLTEMLDELAYYMY